MSAENGDDPPERLTQDQMLDMHIKLVRRNTFKKKKI